MLYYQIASECQLLFCELCIRGAARIRYSLALNLIICKYFVKEPLEILIANACGMTLENIRSRRKFSIKNIVSRKFAISVSFSVHFFKILSIYFIPYNFLWIATYSSIVFEMRNFIFYTQTLQGRWKDFFSELCLKPDILILKITLSIMP